MGPETSSLPRWLSGADTALTAVEKLFTGAAALCLALIALTVTGESVMRYLFSSSYAGAEVYVQDFLAPAAAFLALGGAARLHRHIGVTVVVERFPRPVRLLVLSLGALLVAAVFALIAYEGAVRVVNSIASHEISDQSVVLPPWVGYLAVPLGSGVLALRMALLPLLWSKDSAMPVSMAQEHTDLTVRESHHGDAGPVSPGAKVAI